MRVRLSNRLGLLLVVSALAVYSAFWGLMLKASDSCWNRSGIMMQVTGDYDNYNRILRNFGEPPLNVCEPETHDYMRILVVGGYAGPYLIRLEPDPEKPRLIFKSGKVYGVDPPKDAGTTDELVLPKEEWRRLLDFLAREGIFHPPSDIWQITIAAPPPARALVIEVQVDGRRAIRSMGEWFGPDYRAIDNFFDAFFDRNARCGFDEDGEWYCSGWHIRKNRVGL